MYGESSGGKGGASSNMDTLFKIPDGAFDEAKWEIKEKVPKLLADNPFDGTAAKYRTWSARVKNHLMGSQRGWLRVLQVAEQSADPLTLSFLSGTKIDGKEIDLVCLSQLVWAFVCNIMTNTMQ